MNVIREMLDVKHGDLELGLFSNAVLDAFVEFFFYCMLTVCLWVALFYVGSLFSFR